MRLIVAACAVLACVASTASAAAEPVAKQLFGKKSKAADLKPRAIGSYAKGCLAGGRMLPVNGPAWQAMRLSRNRNWGHPDLVAYVEQLATQSKEKDGWPGLLVGDLAQPRGGPMLTGHRSHQIGLDADIWLMPMPDRTLSRKEREEISAVSMIKSPFEINGKHWRKGHPKLLKRAASDREVARIFVHPAIKKALCESPEAGDWLRKIRPWWGHHYHFHVRLKCPRGSKGCVNQKPPPAGRGCGKELESWFVRFRKAEEKPKKPDKKPKPRRELKMADLPDACRAVLEADGARRESRSAPLPPARPRAQEAKKAAAAPLPSPKPKKPAAAVAKPDPRLTPAGAPVPQPKPPVPRAAVPAPAPAARADVAPLPSPKPKKPVPAPAKGAAPARPNTAPNLPWLRGITRPAQPLPDRAPRQ